MTIKQIEEIQPEIENELLNRAEITLKTQYGIKHFISVAQVEIIMDEYLNTRFSKMRFKENLKNGN